MAQQTDKGAVEAYRQKLFSDYEGMLKEEEGKLKRAEGERNSSAVTVARANTAMLRKVLRKLDKKPAMPLTGPPSTPSTSNELSDAKQRLDPYQQALDREEWFQSMGLWWILFVPALILGLFTPVYLRASYKRLNFVGWFAIAASIGAAFIWKKDGDRGLLVTILYNLLVNFANYMRDHTSKEDVPVLIKHVVSLEDVLAKWPAEVDNTNVKKWGKRADIEKLHTKLSKWLERLPRA